MTAKRIPERLNQALIDLESRRPGYSFARIRAVLEGRCSAAELTDDEAILFDDLLGKAMETIQTPTEREFWAEFKHEPNTDRIG